jgi:hypothetical protein
MRTKTGKRTAHFRVQIVEDGKSIEMFFDDHNLPPMAFNRETGRSGPKAYGKLAKILDEEEAKEAGVVTDPAVQ